MTWLPVLCAHNLQRQQWPSCPERHVGSWGPVPSAASPVFYLPRGASQSGVLVVSSRLLSFL